jgi:DNA-binding MarR family transcriptional regulator
MPITPETVDRLTAAISELVRTGRHVSGRAAAHIYGELPSYGWALLIPLQRDGDQRVSALAHRAGIDTSVASRQLAVLERHGFVARRPDPLDGRASLFRLTEAGASALAATRSLRSDWAATALADWDDDAAGHLADLLERLVTDIDRAAAPRASRPPALTG